MKRPQPKTIKYYDYMDKIIPYINEKLKVNIYGFSGYDFGFVWIQDDGTEYNKITMNNIYEQIMNNEVKKENQIFTDHSGEGTLSHAEIKALLEIGLERKVKQLVEKLSKL